MFDKRFISRSITYFIALVLALGTFPSLSFAQDQGTTVFTLGDESPAVPSTGAASSNGYVKIEDISYQGQTVGRVRQTATWKRLWGKTYFDTMQKIVQQGWKTSNVAILARSDNYKDALSASSLAGLNNAPVLITAPSSLTSQTKAELTRMKVKKVYIVGGTSAVKPAVETAIKKMGITVERVWGQLADDTAVKVASKLGSRRASTCIVATDAGYWDALAASPYAYAKKAPIFLTRGKGSSLSTATINAIKSGKYKKIVIVGGKYAVKPAVETQLKKLGITVERLWGDHAEDTAAVMACWSVKYGMTAKYIGFATSLGFQDALCGAALCGKNNSIMLIVPDTKNFRGTWVTRKTAATPRAGLRLQETSTNPITTLKEGKDISEHPILRTTVTITAEPAGKYVDNPHWKDRASEYRASNMAMILACALDGDDAVSGDRLLSAPSAFISQTSFKNKTLEYPYVFGGYAVISDMFYQWLTERTLQQYIIKAVEGDFFDTRPANTYVVPLAVKYEGEYKVRIELKRQYNDGKDHFKYIIKSTGEEWNASKHGGMNLSASEVERQYDTDSTDWKYVVRWTPHRSYAKIGDTWDFSKHKDFYYMYSYDTEDAEGYYFYKAISGEWTKRAGCGYYALEWQTP